MGTAYQPTGVRGLITYDGLPIASGGAHRLRSRGFTAAWTLIEPFLGRCTDFDRPRDIIVELLEDGDTPNATLQPLKRRFSAQFPMKRSRRVGAAMGRQWSATTADLTLLLQDLDAVRSFPDARLAPLTLNLTAEFRFVDPHTRTILPFQGPSHYLGQAAGSGRVLGASYAFARLAKRSTVSVFFSLPFAELNTTCRAYVDFLAQHVPFRLSDRGWKIWALNKRGTRYVGRRLPISPEPPPA